MTRDDTISHAVALLNIDSRNGYYAEIINRTAELLARINEIAPYWAEPYAAPIVPIIESAKRVAETVVFLHETGKAS